MSVRPREPAEAPAAAAAAGDTSAPGYDADPDAQTSKRARIEAARAAPAFTFPYPLDKFQQDSIDHLEAGDSVLVSAHTSAGKTTVALYAIAKALKENKRVIYTSPIKALSNQKYREFEEKFKSVGLMTGDTTIRSDADCLVMTTEILRSMLYRGTEMLREVGCVIFDEVHYMRDKSRGVVWEETIIMLPEGCQYVFLSATIPNAHEFSKWVEHIHPTTRCHVVHTNYRPVPLQHFLYPAGADGVFLIVDANGKFHDDTYKKAMASMGVNTDEASGAAGGGGGGDKGGRGKGGFGGKGARGGRGSQQQPIMDIIRLVMEKQMFPVITFSFSKAECERNALAMSRMNFNDPEEEALVQEVFVNAIGQLSDDDQQLPAITSLLPLLQRGVGVHHSGLLPILKEVVEVLFQAGLVKVLFSTETFSMGLNMPARTVVFTSVKKFDGEKNRYLTGGEYIQMSGRAGRRGLDSFGVVIAMVDEAVEHDTLKQLTGGGADVLNSSFHLTYNMILNLFRVEDIDPTYMMVRSFAQFQRERARPEMEARVAALQREVDATVIPDEAVFRQYATTTAILAKKQGERLAIARQPRFMFSFLVEGRLVRIVRSSDGADFFVGIVRSLNAAAHTLDVAVICDKIDPALPREFVPRHVTQHSAEVSDLYVVPFNFADVYYITRYRIAVPSSPNSDAARSDLIGKLAQVHRTYGDDPNPLTGEEMGIVGDEYAKSGQQVDKLKQQLAKNAYHQALQQQQQQEQQPAAVGEGAMDAARAAELRANFARYERKKALEQDLDGLRGELAEVSRTVFLEELQKMTRVLRRLDFLDKEDLVQRKARVACEITTTDENELMLTELLFHGVLNTMEVEMVVALLSCLVNVTKTPDGFSLPEEFQAPLESLKTIVDRVATVSLEAGLITAVPAASGDTFTAGNRRGGPQQGQQQGQQGQQGQQQSDKICPSLMEVTYKWAKGAKFSDIVGGNSKAYEGDIVRMMRRLEEMLRQLAGAAKSPALGNQELHDKFMKGITLIKRDIIFASSLYL